MNTITIMIVAKSGVIREGYQALFKAITGMTVLEPVENLESAVAKLSSSKPELIVLDVGMNTVETGNMLSKLRQSGFTGLYLVICTDALQVSDLIESGVDAAVIDGIPPMELTNQIKKLAFELQQARRKNEY